MIEWSRSGLDRWLAEPAVRLCPRECWRSGSRSPLSGSHAVDYLTQVRNSPLGSGTFFHAELHAEPNADVPLP